MLVDLLSKLGQTISRLLNRSKLLKLFQQQKNINKYHIASDCYFVNEMCASIYNIWYQILNYQLPKTLNVGKCQYLYVSRHNSAILSIFNCSFLNRRTVFRSFLPLFSWQIVVLVNEYKCIQSTKRIGQHRRHPNWKSLAIPSVLVTSSEARQ